jgi:hypothetical protein
MLHNTDSHIRLTGAIALQEASPFIVLLPVTTAVPVIVVAGIVVPDIVVAGTGVPLTTVAAMVVAAMVMASRVDVPTKFKSVRVKSALPKLLIGIALPTPAAVN